MPNLFDYLAWRGDLPFSAVPPCEADELLLSQLSYIFFDGFVPSQGHGSVLLKDAAHAVLRQGQDGKGVHQIGWQRRCSQASASPASSGARRWCTMA